MLVFGGVIESTMVKDNFFQLLYLYQYQHLRPIFFPVSPPGFLRISRQPKKKPKSTEEDKPNQLYNVMLGIQDPNDHSKIPQGKMALWMFDAKKHH